MNRELQAKVILRKLNLVLSDYTEYDDDRWAVIASAIDAFNSLPAIAAYFSHRAEIDEMVRSPKELDEFLKGNYERKKTYKEIRNNATTDQ